MTPSGPPPGYSTGLIPRDYSINPGGYLSYAPVAPDDWLVPESEYQSRLDFQQANRGSLYDLRTRWYDDLKSMDQDGYGLCWAFSSTKAVMYVRAAMGEPRARLSAWWVAGKVVNWRDQGYWGSASLEQITQAGVPTEAMCPAYKRQYDTPAVAADAAQRKVIEWYDGTEDRERNKAIMISAFLLGLPPVLDFNWLGHSMCGCRLVSLSPLTIDCDNSWGETSQYGEKGLYRITGNRCIPDGIVVPRAVLPSP